MNISITGTLSVDREEAKKILALLGHKVIEFSTQDTDTLIIGEKTASPNKIAKAKKAGIRIVEERDLGKVLELVGNGYRNHNLRLSIASVDIKDALAVFADFAEENAEQGEWHGRDARHYLEHPEEAKKYLLGELLVQIIAEEEEIFWKMFRCWLILEYINLEYCEGTQVLRLPHDSLLD